MPGSLQNMRIIAIPLTRPNVQISPIAKATISNRLTYYQFQISARKAKKLQMKEESTIDTSKDSAQPKKKGWLPEEGVVNWATAKAAGIWAGFGKAEGGWKLKTYRFGEKLVDRLEFEELALKSIDPSLGPSITHLKKSPVLDEKAPSKIPLIFPPSILTSSTVLSELRAYTEHRIPRHRKGFYLWLFIAPLTAPFMIIPIIPNLPFFFCIWRSWSHYRAYKSSQYLKSLLDHELLIPEPSEELDNVYKAIHIPAPAGIQSPSTSNSTNTQSTDPSSIPKHILLINRDSVPSIISIFNFKADSTASADLYRAVEQARARVSSGRTVL